LTPLSWTSIFKYSSYPPKTSFASVKASSVTVIFPQTHLRGARLIIRRVPPFDHLTGFSTPLRDLVRHGVVNHRFGRGTPVLCFLISSLIASVSLLFGFWFGAGIRTVSSKKTLNSSLYYTRTNSTKFDTRINFLRPVRSFFPLRLLTEALLLLSQPRSHSARFFRLDTLSNLDSSHHRRRPLKPLVPLVHLTSLA